MVGYVICNDLGDIILEEGVCRIYESAFVRQVKLNDSEDNLWFFIYEDEYDDTGYIGRDKKKVEFWSTLEFGSPEFKKELDKHRTNDIVKVCKYINEEMEEPPDGMYAIKAIEIHN